MPFRGDKSSRRSKPEPGAPGSEDAFAVGGEPAADTGERPDVDTDGVFDDDALEGGADSPDDDDASDATAADATAESPEVDRVLEEQRDKYLRLAAEYDNFRRRTAKERQEAGSRAQAELIKQLVEPLDDLDRFTGVDATVTDPSAIVQGIELVERKFRKALGAAGLEIIDPIDQPFDPALHEAVMTEPALSAEDDHLIARVFQKGYVHNGLLIRPARVVVKQWNG